MTHLFSRDFLIKEQHPLILLLIYLIIVFVSLFISNLFSLLVAFLFYNGNYELVFSLMTEPELIPNSRFLILMMQGIVATFTFIIPALIFIHLKGNSFNSHLNRPDSFSPFLIGLSVLITFVIMAPNSFLIEWNKEISFPPFLSDLEMWAKKKEMELEKLTLFLIHFENINEVFLGFIIFAIIPGIGEELLFRGMFQNFFLSFFKNSHLAIWISAFIFSAIHLQFYGFFPRMLLGALFGYLYFWSGNIWIPIAGHFFNNGFTVLISYLNQIKIISIDLDSTDSIPLSVLISSMILLPLLLFVFKYYSNKINGKWKLHL